MDNKIFAQKMKKMGRSGWTLKPYRLWRKGNPCPPRLVVNVYKGCDYAHKYCYISGCASAQDGFREHLQDRIDAAKALGLNNIFVIVSSSTDPFQPIERESGDSLFAIDALLSSGFPVLVMTRNPQILLEENYEHITRNPRLYIDVSIPSMHENDPGSIFHCDNARPLSETFDTIKKLAKIGKHVRVKIEPIIPTDGKIKGQTNEEISEIVRRAKESGANAIISKTMRMNESVPRFIRTELIEFYKTNGEIESNGNTTNLILNHEIRKKLMQPVYDACKEFDIPFCACVDADVLVDKTESCRFGGE